MKKLLLGAFLIMGILSFSGQRITIKSGSYCSGLIEMAEYDDDYENINELYLFRKCVINGKTYRSKVSWGDSEEMAAKLRIYFNSMYQMENISEMISANDIVYFRPGETIVKEIADDEIIWEINVKKIEF